MTTHSPNLCFRCGKEFERSYRRICPECDRAQREERRRWLEAEDIDRKRDPVEIYAELAMQKYGPGSENLTPRQRLALDRKLADRWKRTLDRGFPIHDEFWMLLFVATYRRGILTPERWRRMRRMHLGAGKWFTEVRALYEELAGSPLQENWWIKKTEHINSDDLKPVLPMLRKMADDPGYQPIESEPQPQQTNVQEDEPEPAQLERDSWDRLTNVLLLRLYIEMEPERRAEMRQVWEQKGRHELLELAGYPVREIEPEPIDPEQIPHADQARIDDTAADLLADVDM